ncbi:ABC transporter permease [Saccharococcus thermophilus]|uniref:ABC-2 type transport system permease protein n=1 Tax=Saccharococcus thermophilus TaxID=29396 RepID=A0A846MKT9_9BACL|nr:ABC transporter permease [Saccharococcus thermophilus]NIK16266.1 ABC-2 type transport system permease protein [Saccharococcus thermophilus]
MMDGRQLWRDRLGQEMRNMRRYLRYMLNDHLLFVLLVALGGGALAYHHWVQTLPSTFPYAIAAALVFSFALTFGSIRTLFREADIVFLLPAEAKLRPYVQRAFAISVLLQGYGLLLLLLLMAPLHLRFSSISLWLFFLVLFILKGWNLWISWKGNYFIEPSFHRLSMAVRFGMNALLLYFLLIGAPVLFLLVLTMIAIGVTVYLQQATKRKGWKWERIIAQEAKAVRAFYRIANLFTDVPQWKEEAKRRRWLDFIVKMIPYGQQNTFLYLYVRTWIRAGGYLGLYIRLITLGCLLLYIIPNEYGKMAASFFFLYITGFQLFALLDHHRAILWMRLYPLEKTVQVQAVCRLLFLLLIVQNSAFHLFLTWIAVRPLWIASWIAGNVFSYWLIFHYLVKRHHREGKR